MAEPGCPLSTDPSSLTMSGICNVGHRRRGKQCEGAHPQRSVEKEVHDMKLRRRTQQELMMPQMMQAIGLYLMNFVVLLVL